MRKFMTNLFVKMTKPLRNERGAQSLEWLGIAALLILVLGIISSALSNSEGTIGEIINNIISQIQGMVGGGGGS